MRWESLYPAAGRTPAGQTNLTRIWTDKGGARLYWNTLVDPLQIRMAGARFDDPAAVPELRLTPPEIKPVPRRYRNGHKKVQARKAAPATVPRVAAPKGVGSAALMPPPVGEKAAPAAAPARNAASVSGALSASDASNSGRPAAAPASGATPLPYPGSRAWMEKMQRPGTSRQRSDGQAAGASRPAPRRSSATHAESTPPAKTAPLTAPPPPRFFPDLALRFGVLEPSVCPERGTVARPRGEAYGRLSVFCSAPRGPLAYTGSALKPCDALAQASAQQAVEYSGRLRGEKICPLQSILRPHTRSHEDNKLAKLARLCDALGLKKILKKNDLAAVKLHFGEYSNDTTSTPPWCARWWTKCWKPGPNPSLPIPPRSIPARATMPWTTSTRPTGTASPPQWRGARHLADGLYSENCARAHQRQNAKPSTLLQIRRAPAMVVLSHFKGHEMAGFGGAIKNLAMGGAAVRGKRDQHATHVSVESETCIGCGKCVKVCPQQALSLHNKKSVLDKARCIGCFECMTVCPVKAISLDWATEMVPFMERLTEYAYGAVKGRGKRVCYINFVLNGTPDCDCVGWSDLPLVPDVGLLASTDPVALDQACLDMVNAAPRLGSRSQRRSGRHLSPVAPHQGRSAIELARLGLGSQDMLKKSDRNAAPQGPFRD